MYLKCTSPEEPSCERCIPDRNKVLGLKYQTRHRLVCRVHQQGALCWIYLHKQDSDCRSRATMLPEDFALMITGILT
jgi:hypothetical protein